MVKKNMYQEIQKLKKKGCLKSEISRKLAIDPETAAKYYHMSEEDYRAYALEHMYRDKSFDRYRNEILDVYERNENRRLLMAAVYDYLEERYGKLPGGEKTLRNYIGYLIDTNQLELREPMRAYMKVPQLPFGKQLQLDFGEYRTPSGLKLYIFAAVLSASRYKYVAFQGKAFTTIDLIGHLLDCFEYIGGLPEELVIDQDAVMVVSENRGDIIYTKSFGVFIEEMGLRMYVCRKADPETKGKVENLVGYVKQNFLSTRDFQGLSEARERLSTWLMRRANGKISQATKRIPAEVIEEERAHLRPLKASIFQKQSIVGREERVSDENALISVNASQYALPPRYRNKRVEIYKTEDTLFVFDRHTGEEIIEHTLSLTPGAKIGCKSSRRRDGRATMEMREEVRKKVPLARWGEFLEANYKAYTRYVRDQCIEAEARFGGDVVLEVLDRALAYCLEHGTYSMTSLYDTYQYYKEVWEATEEDDGAKKEPQLKEVAGSRGNIQVSHRDLKVYTSVVRAITGVRA
jgi:transposase